MTWGNDDLVLFDDEPLTLAEGPAELFFFADEAPGAGGARPVVTIVSPPEGGPIAPREPFVFTVTCSEEIVLQRFNVRTGGPSTPWEVQYRDGVASPGAVVTRDAITDGFRFTVRRETRWAGRELEFEPTFGTAASLAAMNE